MLSNFGLIYSFVYVIIILIMAKNNNRCKTQNKYSQRRDNLVGLKRQPLPRNKRERQIKELSSDLKNFDKVLKSVSYAVREKLGYDFNKDYATNQCVCVNNHKSSFVYPIGSWRQLYLLAIISPYAPADFIASRSPL